jgi:integrase
MTLVKRGRYWHYDFWYRGKRHQRSTEQELRADAEQVEREAKRHLRREAHGIAPLEPAHTPSFSAWAETYLAVKKKRLRRCDVLERTLRMVLAFWGARPTQTEPVAGGVYHNLRLADPILNAQWIEDFEDWMGARGLSGSTKNSYRSALSGMYKLARKPRYRQRTRVTENPFSDIDRDATRRRRAQLPVEDLRRWMQHAAPHVVLAMAIGAMAPKLRLAQILALRFDKHLDRELTRISFEDHKTLHHTGEAQVTPVSSELRTVLEAVRRARPQSKYVITFRGKAVSSIKLGTAKAAARAGLTYGMKGGGITFHSLRGAMATECARLGIPELLAAQTLGHRDQRTTRQHYIHLVPDDERAVVERLSQHVGVTAAAVTAAGKTAGTRRLTAEDIKRMRAKMKAG